MEDRERVRQGATEIGREGGERKRETQGGIGAKRETDR
jgi:hypothetical protein